MTELYNCGVNNVSIFNGFLAHRYRLEIPEPAPSLSLHGAPIGVFARSNFNRDSSGAYVLRSEREDKRLIKRVKRCTAQEDGGHILFVFVSACVDGKTLNTPKELHG